MNEEEIRSVGWLHNHDGSIALSIGQTFGHTFVTISKQEFDDCGGIKGITKNKQLAVDFYKKYGAGRP